MKDIAYLSIYHIVEEVRKRGLVIYGAGFWGKITYEIFSLFDVEPIYYCDDTIEKQGTKIKINEKSIDIVSLDEASLRYPDAVYVVASAGTERVDPRSTMLHKLRERGVYSKESGFHPYRYVFLLEGGWEAMQMELDEKEEISLDDIYGMVVLNHMSNSGIVYFNTLMDGHPNILNIPEIGARVALKWLYENRIKYLEGEALILEIASQMYLYLQSKIPDTSFVSGIGSSRIAFHWYKNKEGEAETKIYIDVTKFIKSLRRILFGNNRISFSEFIKSVYVAYANAINKTYKKNERYWILYERHKANYDHSELDSLLKKDDFKRLEYWCVIREPIQHLFSIIRRQIMQLQGGVLKVWNNPEKYIEWIASDLGLMLEYNEKTKDKVIRVIRFEDLKLHTNKMMKEIAKILEISFDENMLNTTANGIDVYFPANASGTRSGAVISSSDTSAVNRSDFSSLFTQYDIFRLNLLFYNFKKTYGYSCDYPNLNEFSYEFIEELLSKEFKFEKELDGIALTLSTNGERAVNNIKPCHEYITNLFLDYVKKDHELVGKVIDIL